MRKQQHGITEITLDFSPPIKYAKQPKITTSLQAYRLSKQFFTPIAFTAKMQVIVIYLNKANRVIGVHRLSTGGLTSTIVDVRLILAIALKSLACGIVLAHTRPSGDYRPSEADMTLTMKLKDAAVLMDIKLYEHLVITADSYYSFNDKGLL